MPEHWHPRSPATPAQWQAYYALRWQILRAPWGQAPGSERDKEDAVAQHCLVLNARGDALGVGRLHPLKDNADDKLRDGQIRYMAVAATHRGQGIGAALLDYLEDRARALGMARIVLNARENAAGFYRSHGYCDVGDGPLLYGEIAHRRMRKTLSP